MNLNNPISARRRHGAPAILSAVRLKCLIVLIMSLLPATVSAWSVGDSFQIETKNGSSVFRTILTYKIISDKEVMLTNVNTMMNASFTLPTTVSHDGTNFNVTAIDNDAFASGTVFTLTSIYINHTTPPAFSGSFGYMHSPTLYVPAAVRHLYDKAPWNQIPIVGTGELPSTLGFQSFQSSVTVQGSAAITYTLTSLLTEIGGAHLTWSVDDPTIATIDESGIATALKAGTTKYTCVLSIDGYESTVTKTGTLTTKAPSTNTTFNINHATFKIINGNEVHVIGTSGEGKSNYSVEIPETITYFNQTYKVSLLADGCFTDKEIGEIHFTGSTPISGSASVFSKMSGDAIVYVPAEYRETYATADGFNQLTVKNLIGEGDLPAKFYGTFEDMVDGVIAVPYGTTKQLKYSFSTAAIEARGYVSSYRSGITQYATIDTNGLVTTVGIGDAALWFTLTIPGYQSKEERAGLIGVKLIKGAVFEVAPFTYRLTSDDEAEIIGYTAIEESTDELEIPLTTTFSDKTFNVVGIGENAITDSSLKTVRINKTDAAIVTDANAFNGIEKNLTIYVPATLRETYAKVAPYNKLTRIIGTGALPETFYIDIDETINVTGTQKIDYTLSDALAEIGWVTIEWNTANEDIAVIDDKGVATATGTGKTKYSYVLSIKDYETTLSGEGTINAAEQKDVKFTVDGIVYESISESEVKVTGVDASQLADQTRATVAAEVTYNGIAYAVTTIGQEAFLTATRLTAIDLPEGIERIEDYGLWLPRRVDSVTIPASVIYLGSDVIDGPTEVHFLGTVPPATEDDSFSKYFIANNPIIYVPAVSRHEYASETPWNKFESLIGVGELPEDFAIILEHSQIELDLDNIINMSVYLSDSMDEKGIEIESVEWIHSNEGIVEMNTPGIALMDATPRHTVTVTPVSSGSSSVTARVKLKDYEEPLESEPCLITVSQTTGLGVITIDSLGEDTVIYNLSGVRVKNPRSGIYIVNGEKVYLK